MASRLQIARARARVAVAKRTGEELPAEVIARAALQFETVSEVVASASREHQRAGWVRAATARASVALSDLICPAPSDMVVEDATLRAAREYASPRFPQPTRLPRDGADGQTSDYWAPAGVHAHGRDFGLVAESRHARPGRQLTPEEEEALIDGKVITREGWERAKAAVTRGELDEAQRRTRRAGLLATMSSPEVEDWLGIGSAKRTWMLSVGELFAFVVDDELRYPTWQFTDDQEQPILPHLSRLTPKFDDGMHPASILRFMTTAHELIWVSGEPASPVGWLLSGGSVQDVIDILEIRSMY